MKLLLCLRCGDVVQMREQQRSCLCGESSGRYLEDGSTVEQTAGSISLALHNGELRDALHVYHEAPGQWHPLMVFRAFVNPQCETDVRFVREPSARI